MMRLRNYICTITLSALYFLSNSSQEKKTILVTGGAGYVGSHIAFVMSQQGYNVLILDHKIKKRHPWARYFEADVADEIVLGKIFTEYKVEGVFHCAARAIVSESFSDALPFYDTNIAKTIKLLQVMLQYGVKKFIFASSRSVYGNAHVIPIPETHTTVPLSPYARTKLMTETILDDLHKAVGLEYVAIRFVNAVGAAPEHGLGEDHDPEKHAFPLLIRAAKYHKPFIIYGDHHQTLDGTCVRSYIHVLDIAQANFRAFEYLCHGGQSGIFNLGSEVILSIRGMISAVEKYYNTTIETILLPKRLADSPELITDYSKARTELHWQPLNSTLNNIIKSMDEYEKIRTT